MRENWVKYDVSVGMMLKTGVLVKDEFMLLSYMLNQCDKDTGIIITNSRLLSIELDVGRKWVSNLLSSLKKKERIQNPDGAELNLRQKKGNTKPYPIYLCDSFPNGSLDREKTETRQRPDRGQTLLLDRRNAENVGGSQSEQGVDAVGMDVAPERDLDLELERTTTTEVAVPLPSAEDHAAETKSDRLVVQGAIVGKYKHQIANYLPTDPKTMDLLELYPVHQITEAIDRMPLALTPKDPKTKITGNYALGMSETWIKNPSWGV